MQIIHKIDDFLFTIFPKLKLGGGNSVIISELENYPIYPLLFNYTEKIRKNR